MVNQRPWKSQKNSSCDGENTKINHVRQMLNVIFTYHHKCMEHVGKYTSPMEHMGTGSSHIVWNNYSTVHEGFCSLTVGSLGFATEFVSFWWPLRSVLTWFFNPFLLHWLMAQVKQKNYFLSIRGEDKQTNAWTLKSSPSNYWMNYCISCGIANLMQQKKIFYTPNTWRSFSRMIHSPITSMSQHNTGVIEQVDGLRWWLCWIRVFS